MAKADGHRDPLVEVIAEAYHQWQYGDNGTHDTLIEAARVAEVALAAVPDGWAKVAGVWVEYHTVNLLHPGALDGD